MTSLRTRLLAGVQALTLVVTALLVTPLAAPAKAAPAPNPWARTTITKIYDGTGHGTSAQTFINSENGYVPGDDTPTDGVVASGDTVGYTVNTVIEGGPARTVQVVFDLPDYLSFDPKLNAGLCQSSSFVKAAFVTVDGNPGCNYTVPAGVGAAVQQNLILTAKDTAGTAQYDQVPTASVRVLGQSVYGTSAAEPVTVVSAPTADLVLRPDTCSVNGACGSVTSSATSGAFEVMVEPLRWPGYETTKGASTLTPWSAKLDVSAFPAGTTWFVIEEWSVDGVALTPVGGLLPLNDYTGNKTVSFEVPANWGGDEFAEGESRSFDAHLVVPSTAFSTPDFDNNGTGWQPGDGEPKGVSTLNMRDTGARRGYVYANNDHTAYQVYKPVPVTGDICDIFTKVQTRPWDGSDTLWGDGNKLFAEGTPQRVYGTQYWEMVPGTELMSQVTALTQKIAGVAQTDGLIISDQWDTTYVVADPSREAYVTGPDGAKITTGFTMQWSKSVTGAAVVDPSDAGWITSNKPVAGAKSARVIFDSLPADTAAEAGAYSFHVPTVVRADLIEPTIPKVTDDRMYGGCETCIGDDEDFIAVPVSIVTMGTPVLGVYVSTPTVTLDRSTNKVDYTVAPTVGGLMEADALINGTLTVSLDPCIIDIATDAASPWEIVEQDLSLSCGEAGSNTVTLKLKDGFLPSSDLTNGKAQLPKFVFSATYSALAEDTGSVSALWDLTSIDGQQAVKLPDVVEVSDSAVITIPVRSSAGQSITTSTPKVEITDSLKFQATVEAKIGGQSAAMPTQTVVVLPGKGDDAAFLSGLSGYTGAESSNFNGTYTLSSVTIDTDNSVAGTQILCTTDANPSLDPSVGNWSSTCGPDTTAIKIVQPGGDNAGVSVVDIELAPVDNKVGDLYLAWIGPVTGEGITAGRSWPAQDVVVASDIEGYVYWDAEGRGADRTPDSPGIEGVTVELLDKNGNVISTTQTNADGFYEFVGYHSGDYTTRVARGVPATVESEFHPNTDIDVTQTYSFRGDRLANAKPQSDTIALGIDTRFPNVNFGYHAPDPYSDLMKSVSKVDCPDDPATVCNVTWDVTVKNPSKMTLTDGKLTDSTSSVVYDLQARTGERVVKVVNRDNSGGFALTSSGDVYSWGIGNNGANGNGSGDANLTAQIVQGLPGDVTEVISRGAWGGYALTSSGDVYSWGVGEHGGNGNGSEAVNLTAQLVQGLPGDVTEVIARRSDGGYALTSSGAVYSWGMGDLGANGNGSTDDNLTAQLVQGLPGDVTEVIARINSGGYALTSSGDVYSWGYGSYGSNGNGSTADNLTAQLVQGLPGDVTAVIDGNTVGGYALTSSGDVYSWGIGNNGANGNGSNGGNLTAKLVQGLPGDVTEVMARDGSGGYALTSLGAVYSWGDGGSGANGNGSSYVNNLTAQLVQGLPGDVTEVIARSSFGGFALTASGDVYSWGWGYLGANGNGSEANNLTAQIVQGLPADVTEVIARVYGGYALTSSGDVYSWGVGWNGANGNGSTDHNLTAQLVQGFSGDVTEVIARGIQGGYALTSSGAVYSWGVGGSGANGNGSEDANLTAQLVQGFDLDTVMLQPVSETVAGDFTTREYQLPNLAPGEETVVTLTGKVNKPSFEANNGLGLVIGNQAWESFKQTPRTAPTLPDPVLPAFDPANPTAAGKWTGNDTCTATKDWAMPGDQCDQVYASVPTTNQLLGALEGYTWHDANRDGVMDPKADEPRLVGVKVTLWKGTNGEFATKAGETVTDAEGYYKFTSLVPSTETETDGYYVTFAPVANPELSNGKQLLTEGQSWTWTTPYDQAPWYAVDRSASHEGMTRNVAVAASATTTPVNGGVVVHKPAIEVSKGYLRDGNIEAVHTPALDADKPGWTVATPVTVTITNTGEESLSDLVFTDTLISGEQVEWAQCTIGETTVPLKGTWTDGAYSFAFDPALTLPVDESMTCTGTLPAMTTDSTVLHVDTVKVDGVGTVTGKPVTDDSTFTVNPPSPSEMPTPEITLEKGILFPLVEGTDCTDPANAKDATKCGIDPGVATLDGGVAQRITFRVTNTGEETLLDMALDDVTVVGNAKVEDLTCQWETSVIDGKERRYLPVGGVALCSGTLTLPNTPDPSDHKNEAEVTAVGHISRTVVTDEAEFTARSRFNVDLPEVPMTGGTGAALLIGGGLGVLALAAATFLVGRRRKQGVGNDDPQAEQE